MEYSVLFSIEWKLLKIRPRIFTNIIVENKVAPFSGHYVFWLRYRRYTIQEYSCRPKVRFFKYTWKVVISLGLNITTPVNPRIEAGVQLVCTNRRRGFYSRIFGSSVVQFTLHWHRPTWWHRCNVFYVQLRGRLNTLQNHYVASVLLHNRWIRIKELMFYNFCTLQESILFLDFRWVLLWM